MAALCERIAAEQELEELGSGRVLATLDASTAAGALP